MQRGFRCPIECGLQSIQEKRCERGRAQGTWTGVTAYDLRSGAVQLRHNRGYSGGSSIIGQPRATEALQFGVELRDEGYNIFALGPAGVGKSFVVGHFLREDAARRATPSDLCYINNFSNPQKPKLLLLPAGKAIQLKNDVDELIENIGTSLPVVFETDEYQSRLHALRDEVRSRPARLFEALQERANSKGLAMLQTPVGVAFAPAHGGEVLTPEEFEKLTTGERGVLQKDIEQLQEEVQKILRQVQRWEHELHEKIRDLNHEVASFAVAHLIEEISGRYREHPNVLAISPTSRRTSPNTPRNFCNCTKRSSLVPGRHDSGNERLLTMVQNQCHHRSQ